jgi:hypothetical protein
MKTIQHACSGFAISALLACATIPAIAAPTVATTGGATVVKLAPSFLGALAQLQVTPGAIGPGKIYSRDNEVFASFPITTGGIDLGAVKAEVDHSGGLSLTAGATTVQLTSFIIDLTGDVAPVLTGLVTVNGDLVGRLPLFDLNLGNSVIKPTEHRVSVTNVAVTLNNAAAGALNKVFKINVLSNAVVIGTAAVRARLEDDEARDD